MIHRSDQGSQYTSLAFGKRCKEIGLKPSMGSVGDGYDNAMADSFATLECEPIDRRSWPTKAEARMAPFTWIEAWYDPRRRHSALDYDLPRSTSRHDIGSRLQNVIASNTRYPSAAWHASRRRRMTLHLCSSKGLKTSARNRP